MEGEAEGVGLGRKEEDLIGRASEHIATVRKSCQSHQELQHKDLSLRSAGLGGWGYSASPPTCTLCSAMGWDFLGRDSSAISQQHIQGAVSGGH